MGSPSSGSLLKKPRINHPLVWVNGGENGRQKPKIYDARELYKHWSPHPMLSEATARSEPKLVLGPYKFWEKV